MPTRHDEWTDAQHRTSVAVDDHELTVAYYEGGTETSGDGSPVVFVHGIPTWSFLWRDVVSAIESDRRVIAPDMVGYGNSSMRDGFDRSIRTQEAMLDALLASIGLDSSISIVAHDIGGGVALRYAWHNPDAVDRLVLSNATCYDSWPVEFINDLGLPSTPDDLTDDDLESKLDFAFGHGLYGDAEDHEPFVEGMMAPWLSEEGRVSLSRCAVATNTNHTTEIDYSSITAETLLLWGADDVLQPIDYARRLQGDLGGEAEVVGLDRAYHWVVEDRLDAYREHLRSFLLD